jgi:hypothetical protein
MTTSTKLKTTSIKNFLNGRRPQIEFFKLKTNQSTKINLIGCDTIVNSPSLISDGIPCLPCEM